MQIGRLLKRSQFLHAKQHGFKIVCRSLILQWVPPTTPEDQALVCLGLTVTSKIGSAVVRNRIKRKLRPLVRQLTLEHAVPAGHLILIARQPAYPQSSAELLRDLRYCLRRLRKEVPASQPYFPPPTASSAAKLSPTS